MIEMFMHAKFGRTEFKGDDVERGSFYITQFPIGDVEVFDDRVMIPSQHTIVVNHDPPTTYIKFEGENSVGFRQLIALRIPQDKLEMLSLEITKCLEKRKEV